MISGFVMILGHHADFGVDGRGRLFILKRIGRIAPLYWLLTILYATKLTIEGTPPSVMEVLKSIFFIPQQLAGVDYGRPVYGLGWTLQYEMTFYLIFACALFFQIKAGVLAIFVVFVGWVLAQSAGLLGKDNPIEYFGNPIVLYFLGGIAIGMVRIRFERARLPFGLRSAIALALVAATIALLTRGIWSDWIGLLVGCVVASLPSMLGRESPQRGWLAKSAKYLGDATYSVYLTHTLAIAVCVRIYHKAGWSIALWVFLVAMIVVSSIVGQAVYLLVERRLLKFWTNQTSTVKTA